MSERYHYETEKKWIFTDTGQRAFLKVRDNAFALIDKAGAFMALKPFRDIDINIQTFAMMAILDRMMELGDIHEVTPSDTMGQYRVFTLPPAKLMGV